MDLVIFLLVWDFLLATFFFVFGTLFGRKKVALLNPFRAAKPPENYHMDQNFQTKKPSLVTMHLLL